MAIVGGAFQNVISLFNILRTAVISGTATATIDEDDITAGGKTIIITLTNGIWLAAGELFDAQRQGIIDGLDSAQSETLGWNNEVRGKLPVSSVSRTSNTIVTVTLTAQNGYDITADETITATIPIGAVENEPNVIIATPTFQIDEVASDPTSQWSYKTNQGPSNENCFKTGVIIYSSVFYGDIILDDSFNLDYDNDPVFGGPFGDFWQRQAGGTNQLYTIEDHGDGSATYYATVNGNNNATRSEIATEFGFAEANQGCTFVEN